MIKNLWNEKNVYDCIEKSFYKNKHGQLSQSLDIRHSNIMKTAYVILTVNDTAAILKIPISTKSLFFYLIRDLHVICNPLKLLKIAYIARSMFQVLQYRCKALLVFK